MQSDRLIGIAGIFGRRKKAICLLGGPSRSFATSTRPKVRRNRIHLEGSCARRRCWKSALSGKFVQPRSLHYSVRLQRASFFSPYIISRIGGLFLSPSPIFSLSTFCSRSPKHMPLVPFLRCSPLCSTALYCPLTQGCCDFEPAWQQSAADSPVGCGSANRSALRVSTGW